MKKVLILLILFAAVSAVTFGQTQKKAPTKVEVVTMEPYQAAPVQNVAVPVSTPKQAAPKPTVATPTGTTNNLATMTSKTSTKTSTKTSMKGCCGMNGEKHACCAGMSKADYKKWKKNRKANSAL